MKNETAMVFAPPVRFSPSTGARAAPLTLQYVL